MPVSAGGRIFASTINTIMLASNETPLCRCTAGAVQALAHNTTVPLAFSAEDFDTNNFHDIVTNNSRITPTVPGYYTFDGSCFFPSRTDWTNVNLFIRINGATTLVTAARLGASQPNGAWSLNLPPVMWLMNGTTDYAELCAQQSNLAAAASTTVNGGFQTNLFQCRFIRPA